MTDDAHATDHAGRARTACVSCRPWRRRPGVVPWVVAALVFTLLASGACRDGSKDDVAAWLDGRAITRSEVHSAAAVSQVEGDNPTEEQTLETLIGDQLVTREAARLGAVADESIVDERVAAAEAAAGGPEMLDQLLADSGVTRERFRERARSIVLTEALQKIKFPDVRASAADARRYYANHRSRFSMPEAVKLGVIQAKTAGPIEQALKEIRRGDSFADAARRHTIDEIGRQTGGQQGWIQSGSVPPGLAEVVAGLQPGQVSGAVQAWPGWYLVKVYGRRPARVYAFARVRADIVAELTRRRQAAALREWLETARRDADIVVNP